MKLVRLWAHNLLTGKTWDKSLPEQDAYKFITGLPDFCCMNHLSGQECRCWYEIRVEDLGEVRDNAE